MAIQVYFNIQRVLQQNTIRKIYVYMHDPKTAREHAHILLREASQQRKQACENA